MMFPESPPNPPLPPGEEGKDPQKVIDVLKPVKTKTRIQRAIDLLEENGFHVTRAEEAQRMIDICPGTILLRIAPGGN
jgi:hypothetical protein